MTRPQPSVRADYPFFTRLHTRWDDNDIYGHLNNTVHYKLMDTAVNGWLLDGRCGVAGDAAWQLVGDL